jgi:hypothetical protein
VLVAGGVVLYLVAPSSHHTEQPAAAWQWRPVVGPGVAAVSVTHDF